MSSSIGPFGSATVVVPPGESVAVYTKGAAQVSLIIAHPNHPEALSLLRTVSDTQTLFGPYASGARIVIDSGAVETLYNVGTAPFIAESGALQVANRKLNLNNIGTRIFTVMNTSYTTSVANRTFTNQIALEQHFDAVQLIYLNVESSGFQIAEVSIGVSDGTDLVNPVAGSCIPVTFNGVTPTTAAPITLPASTGTSADPDFYFSDMMKLSSIPRADGGTLPLLNVRTYFPPTSGSATVATFAPIAAPIGSDTWGDALTPGGRTWRNRRTTGNFATVTSGSVPNLTDVNNHLHSGICGIRYLARGSVVGVMVIGDSTRHGMASDAGVGVAVLGASAELRACHAVSDINSIAFQGAACGYSGQTLSQYYTRAVRLIPLFKPDIVLFAAGSQNSASITQNAINSSSYYTALTQKLCKDNGSLCILTNELARNSADGVSYYTAGQDAFRQAYNAELISRRNKGILVVDVASTISAGGSPAPNKIGYTESGNWSHPNDLGYDAMSIPIAAELLNIKNANLQ